MPVNVSKSSIGLKIPKSATEEIHLSISEYRGHPYIDLRVYYRDDAGDFQPSRKGLTLAPERWGEFRAALEQLEAEMVECGLLEKADHAD